MTNYEAVKTAIAFDKPKYLPFWDNFWGEFPQRWRDYMNFDSSADPADYYNVAISIQNADETFFPSQKACLKSDKNYKYINDGWGRIIRVAKNNSHFSETHETLLENTRNLEQLTFDKCNLDSRFENFAETVIREKEKGRYVIGKVGGIYCRSQFARGEENLLMDMAMDEKFCNDFFDKVATHLTEMALETLKRGNLWDTGLFVYDDMATNASTIFSPAMFEKYFLPRYKTMIKTLNAAGCKHFFFHSDGNIQSILDMLIDAGFEGFNPLEPRSGMDILKLRNKYGDKIVFFGGVCNTVILPRGDKREIANHVLPRIELGKEGGLIIGQASIGEDIRPEIYEYYISLIKEHGTFL